MKNCLIITIHAAALLLAALLPLHALGANAINYTATYSPDNVAIDSVTIGGTTYSTVKYEGLNNVGIPGMPALPIEYIRISVPYNASNITVSSVIGNGHNWNLPHLLCPWQPMGTVSLPDSAAYYSNSAYPAQVAWVVDDGLILGENHIATIAISPFLYTHSSSGFSDRLFIAQEISITVNYDLGGSMAAKPMIRKDSTLREKGYSLVQSLVVNPAKVKQFAPQTLGGMSAQNTLIPMGGGGNGVNGGRWDGIDLPPDPLHPVLDSIDSQTEQLLNSGNYPYIIVTSPELKHSMRRLAALRRQKGINVYVATMDNVRNNVYSKYGDRFLDEDSVHYHISNGSDAGKLREYLKFFWSELGAEYALLAGSTVPYLNSSDLNGSSVVDQSDLYFADLDWDWANEASRFHEIMVGRLLGDSKAQFDNYTDKVFRYELNPGNGDLSYLRNALYTETLNYETLIEGAMAGLGTICPDSTLVIESFNNNYPTGNDVVDAINSHRPAFMASLNDGTPSYIKVDLVDEYEDENSIEHYLWATDTIRVAPDVTDSEVTGNGLNRLSNKDYPMVYYSLIGQTMPYDTVDGYEVDANFGESFTMGKDYGGPVYMGKTHHVSEPYYAVALSRNFADLLQSGHSILSEAHAFSLEDINIGNKYDNLEFAEIHNYLGDPMIDMWTDIPQRYTGILIDRRDSTIIVSNVPLGTHVAYCSNDGEVGYHDATDTQVTLQRISPNSTIMLYDHNYLPYIAPLIIQNQRLRTQYVIADDYTAGAAVDANRPVGEVVIDHNAAYEVEFKGDVRLEGGFKVEKGATFAVYPSNY